VEYLPNALLCYLIEPAEGEKTDVQDATRFVREKERAYLKQDILSKSHEQMFGPWTFVSETYALKFLLNLIADINLADAEDHGHAAQYRIVKKLDVLKVERFLDYLNAKTNNVTQADNVQFDYPDTTDAISLYMHEISRSSLLTFDEEVDLAVRIQNMANAKKYLAAGGLSESDRDKYEKIAADGDQAFADLCKANARLVVSIAKRYIGRGVPFADLIQEGNLGLMRAAKKYERERGFRFSTYATWWIRQAVTRAIATLGNTVRMPVHMVEWKNKLYRTVNRLEQELKRIPTDEEIALAMDMETEDFINKRNRIPKMLSLDGPVDEEDENGRELYEVFEETANDSENEESTDGDANINEVQFNLLREKISEILDTLPAREARILRLRYGLEDGEVYTLEEVGVKFGLTRERIRQIEAKALHRLRHPWRARQLKEYRT
jgi:RNA polymerase primary sigma factor